MQQRHQKTLTLFSDREANRLVLAISMVHQISSQESINNNLIDQWTHGKMDLWANRWTNIHIDQQFSTIRKEKEKERKKKTKVFDPKKRHKIWLSFRALEAKKYARCS